MKIVFITSGTVNSSISYRSVAFAKELVKKGHEVYIIAPRFDKYSKFIDEKISTIDGIKIVRPIQFSFFSFELGLIPYILSSLFLLFKINPDVIHIYKANPITAFGLFFKYVKKIKVVFDTDDLDSEVMEIEKNPKIKVMLVKLSEHLLSKYSDAIITGSLYLRNYYYKKFKSKFIMHIPNGAEFANRINIQKAKNGKNRIIFIGNINRISILKPLFESASKLVKTHLKPEIIIIGKGIYLNYFKELAKKLKISDSIKFLGYIPQKNLYKFVKVGDIGYCYMPNTPTQKACSNMKVFQYMQFGAAAVVSDVGDLPLYTFFGNAGYIAKSSNIESLSGVLTDAIQNKKSRMKKISYALKHAKSEYRWSVLAKKVFNLYKQI